MSVSKMRLKCACDVSAAGRCEIDGRDTIEIPASFPVS